MYRDKLADERDIETFDKSQTDILKKYFEDTSDGDILDSPLIFCHFAKGFGETKYAPVPDWEILNKGLDTNIGSLPN